MSNQLDLGILPPSTCSSAVSLVRMFRPRARARAYLVRAAAYGMNFTEWFTSLSHDGSSSKMSALRRAVGLIPFVGDWNTSGMTHFQSLCRRSMSALLTLDAGFPSSPGPSTLGQSGNGDQEGGELFPTPSANEYGSSQNGCPRDGREQFAGKGKPSLSTMARRGLWPTPKGSPSGPDFARADREGSGGDDLATAVARGESGPLSPGFVEWLMGFQRNYTEINHETRHGKKTGSEGLSESSKMRTVRSDRKIDETSQGLLEAPGCENTLLQMPRESRSGYKSAPDKADPLMCDMRENVSIPTQHKQDLLSEVLSLAGCPERREEMEGAFSGEEMRELRDNFRAAKVEGGDLLTVLWEQARMEETQGGQWETEWPNQPRVETGVPNRAARLRCLGNAVVPQCAEVIGWIVREIENEWI